MASQIKVDQIAGAAGNTVTIPAGQTLDVLGTLDIDAGTLVLPNTVVTTTGTQTLTNKTITAPKIGTSILDTNGNELALLTATGSAVNEFTLANAASGNAPRLSATGETNVDLDLLAKGTGHVTVRGNNNSGAVQFNCEDNSHGQIVIAQPHSAGVTNTLTLPAGSSSTLVSRVSTDTLTNKTLTNPILSPTATTAGKVEFLEGTNNGTNKATLIGPASTADVTITLPAATDTLVGKATTDTLTNKTINASQLINATVSLSKLANGTDGNLISYDASGAAVAVATGNASQVLTSAGAGAPPVFADAAGGGTSWQAVKTGAYTAVAGEGVFVNTTSSAFTITLPSSPTLGDEVAIIDYAGTFDSNNCTIGRNSQKIQGAAEDLVVATERAGFTLVFTDGTQGWLLKNN